MRRAIGIGVVVLVLLAGIGIGVGVYNAGVHDGISQGLQQSGENTEVVRVVDRGFRGGGYGYGFFPFGFIFFPLLVIGIILLARAAFWGGRGGGPWRGGPYGGGWGGPGPWAQGGPQQRFEEWHRRQHEQRTDEQPSTTGEQADV